MQDNIHLETNFEQYITRKLADLGDGWRVSNNDKGFDPDTALYMPDFIEFLTATAPEKVKKMQDTFKTNWESNLRAALVKSLEVNGTVLTIRNGFQMAGFQTIDCSGHYPDDPRIAKAKKLYDANILRVMRQVHYQTAGNKSLDLVFFLNGIPVATAEVKTELTQTVQDAIVEYQTQRKPIEPGSNRKNYLLMFKRGAIVHFAMSEDEIWMCTNLDGSKPRFLPFNLGNNGHKGNPPRQEDSDEYPTGYFWNTICQKENWLRIFQNFIFEKVEKKEDVTGRLREVHTQLFPRYHQWECVTKCINHVKANGVGHNYLIEHSAGSGKTETISWIAHELIRLMDEGGNKVFSSVIVVTDRVGLDTNIKLTIKQLKKTVGLIEMVGGDGEKKSAGAKSKQLAKALKEKREIVVVTLQTFPFAMEAIAEDPGLAGANFAVLIDEAHSSQEGSFSGKMKTALKLAGAKNKKKNTAGADADEVTDEDAINAYFQMQQEARVMPENVSFFAFTATPKAETKTIFGTPGTRVDEKTGQPIPESFHLYPMRQAIEEGFILDVLEGYMPYKTAYKLKEDIVTEDQVDIRAAMRTIAKWESHHPTNVMSKAEFIIEHFVKNVASLLDGQAKAMIVTSSRASVVRYKHAIDAYLRAHPEYDRSKIAPHLQFKVPGEPLVAFSGKISGSNCVVADDEYIKGTNPFALIRTDYDYTEDNMNNLGYQTIEGAFDAPHNRLLIVANKFQTGFNQPKLCAMYIDKKIANDIEIVQTYSRLNRTFSGKDKVYIVDFVNDPETVLRAFRKYDNGAQMNQAQNLNVVYEVKQKLDAADIYFPDEIQRFKALKYHSLLALEENKDVLRQKLYHCVQEPAERWASLYHAAKTESETWYSVLAKAKAAGELDIVRQAEIKIKEATDKIEALMGFRKGLKKYCSAYNFISQIISLGDEELEVFYGFASLLHHRIAGTAVENIDIKNLVLADFDLRPLGKDKPDDSPAELRPMTASSKTSTSKKESLKTIVSKINEIWGENVSPIAGARTINAIADYVAADDVSRIQIRNRTNSREAIIADGRLANIIKLAALSLKSNEFAEFADKIIADPQTWKPIAEMIFDMIDEKKRIDISDLAAFIRK